MNAVIRSIGAYTPERVITNDDLARTIETSDEWIVSHTGIKRRHIAAPEETSSVLATRAGRAALERAGIAAEELDLILVATATPDSPGFPSTACIVQNAIGAVNAGAMDLVAACTGFIYGVETASRFIAGGGARNVLVIAAEQLSRIIDWTDRATCVLFGDGAGAAVLSAAPDGERGVVRSVLRSDGSGFEYLHLVPFEGEAAPTASDPSCAVVSDRQPSSVIAMNGRQVYNFAVRVLGETITNLLGDLSIDDISYVVPHQANIRIIEAAAKRTGIPLEKFYVNIDEYGNTSAASIPIALNEMSQKGLLKAGDVIVTVAFGGGLTYGGNLIRW